MKESLENLLHDALPQPVFDWLQRQGARVRGGEKGALQTAFTAAPRFTGRQPLTAGAALTLPGGRSWRTDELARLWLLLQPVADESYPATVEALFRGAEIGETVLLYSALPLLPMPEAWVARCAEGIRSNVAPVLEALMYENPYPARYLDEGAWNSLVLKAFFTEKDVVRISGLRERANPRLSRMLQDYAAERRAAGRTVPEGLEALAAAGACR